MAKKIFGFTIGEVLIALGVIGIIAILTIPEIIKGRQATEAKTAFNTAYSILSNTISEMDANNISILPASYATSKNFYATIKTFQKVVKDCSAPDPELCFSGSATNSPTYKQLDGTDLNLNFGAGSYVLNNGMLIAVQNDGGENPILIAVDINGKSNPPNKMGYDLFIFELTEKEGLMPYGGTGTHAETDNSGTSSDPNCNITNMTGSGYTCAARALAEESYFTTIYKNY